MSKDFEQISFKPGFMKHNGGLLFKTISENEYEFKATIKKNHLNRAGITHAGFIAALVDSGVGAAAFQLLLAPMISSHLAFTIGASGAVYGVMIAFALFFPDRQIYVYFLFPVKAKYLITFLILIEFMAVGDMSVVAHLAHLGGALLGFIYTKQLEKGTDIGKWFENMINYLTNMFKPKQKSHLKTVHKKTNINRKPTHKESDEKQRQINKILDKIGTSGYESLNKEEKDFLFKSGNKN